jgi:hypothetical protein
MTEPEAVDAVLTAARLAAAAFRLRDDDGLRAALRELARAVAALERAEGLPEPELAPA